MLSSLSPSSPFSPWDSPDILGLESISPKPIMSSSSSDDPNHARVKEKLSSDLSVMNERKRRRMISNRESARRSRMRKQRHLENLRNQLNLFRVENRELNNCLQFLLHHINRLRTENDWLRSERTVLRQKLSDISQILVFQQLQPFSSAWPCNIVP